ncbi:hypothetical protein DAPPUDRAFT_323811 [Daphnia pulex]|uniref:Cadherin domain-containing protein n=1 Tax=Daphnia pulex TaxID=6669 RepID=E9GZU9_DAPPU|nr:hypothetical protein DAPPUDRAFT_323811 [Daphnia pulex]|eukprot:EFX74990.1 hypothetical protein DAPPUDRAFT_323811 [Daphnia pulex]
MAWGRYECKFLSSHEAVNRKDECYTLDSAGVYFSGSRHNLRSEGSKRIQTQRQRNQQVKLFIPASNIVSNERVVDEIDTIDTGIGHVPIKQKTTSKKKSWLQTTIHEDLDSGMEESNISQIINAGPSQAKHYHLVVREVTIVTCRHHVSESQPNMPDQDKIVFSVQAQDGDVSVNNRLLVNPRGSFLINPTTSEVKIAKLIDRDVEDFDIYFYLSITATCLVDKDSGSHVMSIEASSGLLDYEDGNKRNVTFTVVAKESFFIQF